MDIGIDQDATMFAPGKQLLGGLLDGSGRISLRGR